MDRLSVKLTREEKGYYSNLFQMISKEGDTKVDGKEGAAFLKKSGLSRDVLKNIWMIAAQTNLSWLERDEFYVALRLVALAQNNLPCDEKSIYLNEPLPPLPKFDLKIKQEEDWDLPDDVLNKYIGLFDKYKESSSNIVTFQKAYTLFNNAKITTDLINKAIQLIGLKRPNEGFIKSEFVVIMHLSNKTQNDASKIPSAIPEAISNIIKKLDNDKGQMQVSSNIIQQTQPVQQTLIHNEAKGKNTKNSLEDLLQNEMMKQGFGQNHPQQTQISSVNNVMPYNNQQQDIITQQGNPTSFNNINMTMPDNTKNTIPTTRSSIYNNINVNESISMPINNNIYNDFNLLSSVDSQTQNFQNNNNQMNSLSKPINENSNLIKNLHTSIQNNIEISNSLSNEELLSLRNQLLLDTEILKKAKQLLDYQKNDGQRLENEIKDLRAQILDTKRQINITLDSVYQVEKENQRKKDEIHSLKSKFYY